VTNPDSGKSVFSVLRIGLAVLAVLSLIASLNPDWKLWGLDALGATPVSVMIPLVVVLLILLAPGVYPILGSAIERHTRSLKQHQWQRIYIIFGLALVLAFIFLSSQNHLLGDGYTLLENISVQSMSSPTEPLDYAVHHAVYRVLGGDSSSAYLSYRVCAYLCGLLFLIGLYRSVRNKQLLLVVVPAALTFPAIQFFFGYVESYTFSFTLSILYLVSAGLDIDSKRISLRTIVILVLAIGFHLSTAVLVPSLVYLVWNKYRRKSEVLVATAVLLVLFASGILYAHFELHLAQVFLPPLATQNNPYSLLSVAHLRDLFNIFTLDYPLLLLLAPALTGFRHKHRWFYLIALLPALIFVVLLDPKIGALRDWDLLAAASAPSIIAIIWLISNIAKHHRTQIYALSLPLLIFAVMHVGSWVVANSSKERTYEYIANATDDDLHYSPRYYRGYRNRGWAAVVYDDYKDHKRAIRALEKRVRGNPDDNRSRLNLARFYYLFPREYRKAADLLVGRWKGLLDNPESIEMLAVIFKTAGYGAEYRKLCAAVTLHGVPEPKMMFTYFDALIDRGEYDSVAAFCHIAMQQWSHVSPDKRLNVCLLCFLKGRNKSAEACLESLKRFLPSESKSVVDELLQASAENDQARINSLREELANLLL
jgi:hypothetical protein